ncbi:MAG TPA: aminotransferase class III-fold pyridoxal phosphate-dependent enzyme [Candidatus Limnocylindrales bacterium]|nr:aminotransferase class III-fold pyridoxal phosphate-dependent enzyme [Candidatus Limnocylindrales bacterium]
MTEIAERSAERPAGTRPVPDIVTELPGPKARRHIAFDESVTSSSLPRAYPFVPLRGEGAMIEDIDGNRFLDFAAGIAVNSTGHCHPDVVAAIERQARELLHFSASDFYLPIYAELASELARLAPIGEATRVFLTNSGTEAVETAIKLARHATGRQGLVAFLGAFHGRSYGSVSLTASKAKYHARFGPLLPGVVHVPYGSPGLDELEQRVFRRLVPADEVAAIFVEPVQGEGGYVVPDDGFLPRLRRICDEHGIVLVADEVQSGMGRTGRMWAIQHWGVEPDVVLAAKGIASGLPLGAAIARAGLMGWGPGAHGSTFGGNPVSCAAALATIRLLEGGLVENAALRGREALDALRPLVERFPELVREIRGLGLMIGVSFDSAETAEAVQWAAFQRGLLVLEAGDDAVRISPPLVVASEEIATGIQLLGEAVGEVAASRAAVLERAGEAGAINEVEAGG